MSDFKVTGIRVHSPPIPGDGQTVVASIVFESGVFVVAGASLVLDNAGEYRVRLPKFNDHRRVALRSGVGFPALLEAALTAYRSLGGASAVPPLATASPAAEHHHADHP